MFVGWDRYHRFVGDCCRADGPTWPNGWSSRARCSIGPGAALPMRHSKRKRRTRNSVCGSATSKHPGNGAQRTGMSPSSQPLVSRKLVAQSGSYSYHCSSGRNYRAYASFGPSLTAGIDVRDQLGLRPSSGSMRWGCGSLCRNLCIRSVHVACCSSTHALSQNISSDPTK